METKTQNIKSYYDTKDKDKYINDEKSLSKIRSKNLRQFCKFYDFIETAPTIFGLSVKTQKEREEIMEATHNIKGAKAFFTTLKQEELIKMGLNPELLKQIINLVSKRTIYDYMNTVKFIRACNNKHNRIVAELIGVKR